MPRIDFPTPDPSDPSTLEVRAGGITWVWNSTLAVWAAEVTSSGTAAVITSDTAPANPPEGQLWFCSSGVDDGGLRLYVYYDGVWVNTSLPTNIP